MSSGGGLEAGLYGDRGPGVPRPWVGLAGGGGGLSGLGDGALGYGDVDEGLDGVVLGGRPCGGGGRWGEGGSGCGGWGPWFRLGFGLGRCRLSCGCRFCGVGGCAGRCWWCCCCWWCGRLGFSLGLGSSFRLGSGSRLRRTSFRRCEGTGAWWGGLPACCRSSWVARVGVRGPPIAWRVAAALALAVALWMMTAGRGGSEDEVGDIDEDEDEEEVVISGEAGCAVMPAVAGLWAAASAAATAGRMEGMSFGCRFGVGGSGGPAVTWRPGSDLVARRADPIGSSRGGRRGVMVFAFWAWHGRGPAMREVVWVGVRGGKKFAWAAFGGRGGGAWVFGVVCGGLCGPLGGVGVSWGVGLDAVGVCGSADVGGG